MGEGAGRESGRGRERARERERARGREGGREGERERERARALVCSSLYHIMYFAASAISVSASGICMYVYIIQLTHRYCQALHTNAGMYT